MALQGDCIGCPVLRWHLDDTPQTALCTVLLTIVTVLFLPPPLLLLLLLLLLLAPG
jgi:hypothetical protein